VNGGVQEVALTRIVAIANQKGGVGKTTTAVNLAASLAMSGSRVLLIDLDPQGNATMGSGVDKGDLESSIYDWLIESTPLDSVVRRCQGGYELLPGNTDLTAAELDLLRQERREYRMRERMSSEVRSRYDYVIIDCPPSLNILTLNALIAADGVLIPMQCEYYALEGLTALLDTINGVRQRGNPDLAIEGLLRTMYDPRNSLTRDVSRQLIQYFGDKVFRTVIPRNVRLAEAPSHGLPVILYDRHSRGAVAYMALAGELRRKHGEQRE
jgi:chromosome partitioning protein